MAGALPTNALGLYTSLPLPDLVTKQDKERCFSILGYGLPEGIACRQSPGHKVRILSAPTVNAHKVRPRTLSLSVSTSALLPVSDEDTPSLGHSSPSASSSPTSSKDHLDVQLAFPFPTVYIEDEPYIEEDLSDEEVEEDQLERSRWSPSTTCDSPTLGDIDSIFADKSQELTQASRAELIRHPALGALSPKSLALSCFDTLSTEDLKKSALEFGWIQESTHVQHMEAEQVCEVVALTQIASSESATYSNSEDGQSPVSAPSMEFSFSDASAHSSATSVQSKHEVFKSSSSIMDRGRPLPRSVGSSFMSAKQDKERLIQRRAYNASIAAVLETEVEPRPETLECGSPLAIYQAMVEEYPAIEIDPIAGMSPRAELAELFEEPARPIEVKRPSALKNTGRAVAKWLGGLRKVKSHISLIDEAAQDAMLWQTKEPTMRRMPSIEQVISV